MIFGISSRDKVRSLGTSLLLLFGPFLYGQQQTLDVPDSLVKKDSIEHIRLLVVPFSPSMYFSDADKDISDVSKIKQNEVRGKLNASLETTVSEYLDLYYNTRGISKQNQVGDDLDLIFGSINYLPSEKKKAEEPQKSKIKNPLKGKKEENPNPKEEDPYMDISFDDMRMLNYLTEKYETDYILFFNQFEIKTDYTNCLDLQLRKYSREIKLHFTVFSKDGKKITGDVITVPYHSNENDISVIVKENFGEISRQLFQNIYLKR